MHTLRQLIPVALVALAAALVGCPPTDDDDSAEEPVEVGEAPVIGAVTLCEVTVTPDWCNMPGWVVEFRINVTDEDCDLDNPAFSINVEGNNPLSDRFEGSLDCGNRLDIGYCSEGWVRGADISFTVTMTDAENKVSEPYEGTWTVPQPGEDDCGPG